MSKFAVLDTETTWDNDVMSIGVVISEDETFNEIESIYFVIDPVYKRGGMYYNELMLKRTNPQFATRDCAINCIKKLLATHSVFVVMAYNASFDKSHLPEMNQYEWLDIMKVAAYKQHNKMIPEWEECHSTGRLKGDYGVEPMMRLLSGDNRYSETHNALQDAKDELELMKLLGYSVEYYRSAQYVPRSRLPRKNATPIKVGDTYGDLTVLEEVSDDGETTRWKCQCRCGKTIVVANQELKFGGRLNCGICENDLSMIGNKYGKLTIIAASRNWQANPDKDGAWWECQCECGSKICLPEKVIVSGRFQACSKCRVRSWINL